MDHDDQTLLFSSGEVRADSLGESSDGSAAASGRQPLARRMRPRSLSQVLGQSHILGEDCLLPRIVKADNFGSILLYGPPGSGKTSLAEAIARETESRFLRLNAVLSNVAEIREVLRWARNRPQDRTILFIDEIHRFNRAQQDLLLPDVENGVIRLIGATTHNPGFTIIGPLLSRSHLFRLHPLCVPDIVAVLKIALEDKESGLGNRCCHTSDEVLGSLAGMADGDLRRALNALETLVVSLPHGAEITPREVEVFSRERQIRYDRNEDEHYDTASAFIKSIRGGDPDAALYWLAKMLSGGEDPRFLARRLVILASEDVGLADSSALPLAMACFRACEVIGLPECELHLAHATLFLATSPKSNSAYLAWKSAKRALEEKPLQSIPNYLRDASTKTNRALGHGQNYRYSHEFPEAISGQEYREVPEQFFYPREAGEEATIARRLSKWKALKKELRSEAGDSGDSEFS